MTRRKPKASTSTQPTSQPPDVAGDTNTSEQHPADPAPSPLPAPQKALNGKARPAPELSVSPTLIICRNKHTKHISSYSGPWLNLPPEVLDSLAHSNYYSPRPRPIDPAVFFDLVKIRRLIDDATSLAVRAANGTTSASLYTSQNATNGLFNGADAEILGIGSARGGGGHAKLSRERKHRMREHATQKLAHAYRLDEIASSVAMMQSASALEDVAKHVLQRDEQNADAQYVHFFHEKIPSMAVAEYTSLEPLTDVIRQNPTDPSPYRTRSVARMFKDDFEGVVRDSTDGLAVHRLYHSQHQNEQQDLVLARDAAGLGRDQRTEGRLEEKDHPNSLEPQLLFHRAGAYLTLACDNIRRALSGLRSGGTQHNGNGSGDSASALAEEALASFRADARRLVRTYAKRALRDYLAFLSHFDYTPGLSAEYTDAFLERVSSRPQGRGSRSEKLLDVEAAHAHAHAGLSEALVKYESQRNPQTKHNPLPQIPKPIIYRLNELFAAVPVANLPPYPSDRDMQVDQDHPIFSLPDFSEAVTYHPLLTDVLHSVLLCHCLIQTSSKELQRHAHMVARLVRVCDGYPIFLAARSPARADWVEILRRTKNWLGLSSTWDKLCTPTPFPGRKTAPKETAEDKKARIKQEALLEALADERVVDEESFRASFKARELRAARDEEEQARKDSNGTKLIEGGPTDQNGVQGEAPPADPKRWAQEDGGEYPITTERAEVLVEWILEAPPPSAVDGAGRAKKKTGAKGRPRKKASTASSLREATESGLEQGVDGLDLLD
ncbi:histidine kinase group protein [Cladophialophora carrionii]|uniref:Histidine kinase group protein n=1 Tax=Cladophialophora carrionii TaxID=86049 RepID=A0A1C1CU25_9EURO|nr:histidine kinase group protein [Cladophialophora carrionii]